MHETLTVNGQPLSLIFVEGGTFLMGDANGRDTAPVHPVTLSSFYIGQYQVTQALWTKVMGSNPSHFDDPALPVESVTGTR